MKRSVVFLFLLIAVTASAQQGRPNNKNALLKGTYSFIIHGKVFIFEGDTHEAVISGWMTLDGAGKVTEGSGNMTVDGKTSGLAFDPLLGNYHLDTNGYGSMELMLGFLFPQHFIIAVTHLGDSFYIHVRDLYMPFNGGPTYHVLAMSGEATRQGI
ncbi:MAG: hypothetical protein M3041_20685 [Acidobacteriota bacterium]|nr:hypothetical protein [Acidobacteriota bacterium]